MEQADAGQVSGVLVLAPYARDTALTCDLLNRAGIDARSCADIDELCRHLDETAGMVLAMEEALAGEALTRLLAALRQQPRWSDIPVLVVVDAQHKTDDALVRRLSESLGNVVLITRPAHAVTLVSAVRAALRARERQYRLRDALGPYEESCGRLLEALPLAIFVHLDGRVIYANAAAAALLGAANARELVGRPLTRWLHPDVADATGNRLAALAGGGDGFSEKQRWIRADGTGIDVEVDLAPMVWGRRPAVRVSARVDAEGQLRQQVAQLTRVDQRKNEFLAQLAHELRNPLAPIHNAVHVLRIQGDPPDPAHVRWAVEVVGRQVQQLTRLVDDLLDIARIAHGQVVLRREPVELGRVLAQSIEAARPLATARKQTLTYGPPLEPLRVQADSGRLAQVVINLLNNAARYTPVGGHIGLTADTESGHAVIRVRDTGIGIAPEERERIFEPFQQGRRPPDAAPSGLGLGLALVRHLAALHGGTVEARSDGPGKGSEFLVRLPLAPPLAAPAPLEPQAETAGRVLVVDDDPDVAHSFALLLGLMGYQARIANDGAAGLKTAASFRPQVAFIDIGLPDMDGYALARALRRAAPEAPMRLVALTGYTQDEVRDRAVTAGFDAHLLKPVGADTLERLLGSFFRPG